MLCKTEKEKKIFFSLVVLVIYWQLKLPVAVNRVKIYEFY